MELLKYTVSIKKGYKIFYTICLVLCFVVAICICALGLPACETSGNYLVTLFSVGFFLAGGAVCYYIIAKKVMVYKGKILYCTMFKKVAFKPSEVYSSNTKTVETDYRDEMGGWTSAWDSVTTFYSCEGKKLFAFGLAYENVQMLKKTVENTRKSMQNMRR